MGGGRGTTPPGIVGGIIATGAAPAPACIIAMGTIPPAAAAAARVAACLICCCLIMTIMPVSSTWAYLKREGRQDNKKRFKFRKMPFPGRKQRASSRFLAPFS